MCLPWTFNLCLRRVDPSEHCADLTCAVLRVALDVKTCAPATALFPVNVTVVGELSIVFLHIPECYYLKLSF